MKKNLKSDLVTSELSRLFADHDSVAFFKKRNYYEILHLNSVNICWLGICLAVYSISTQISLSTSISITIYSLLYFILNHGVFFFLGWFYFSPYKLFPVGVMLKYLNRGRYSSFTVITDWKEQLNSVQWFLLRRAPFHMPFTIKPIL